MAILQPLQVKLKLRPLKFVLVRTYSAGVHFGTLAARKGKEVTLINARRIWSWTGALSCSEIAQHGITGGKVSCAVERIDLTEAIEVIAVSKAAEKNLQGQPEWKR